VIPQAEVASFIENGLEEDFSEVRGDHYDEKGFFHFVSGQA
jgi:hypothetical protein